jgi:hypothetical protein
MPGLYNNPILIERFQAAISATTLTQVFIAPTDLEVIGLVAALGTTAPGAGNGVAINVSNSPTSQLANVSAYNLWTATNVPTILGASKTTFSTSTTTTVVKNLPYALNYPLPGPSGTTGFVTAQATAQTTETPVTAPPTLAEYQMGALVAPDNVYTDFNGIVNSPANWVHAGDILSFVTSAAGTNASIGAAAGTLEIVLFAHKH